MIKRSGFTLAELIVSMTLLATIVTAVAVFTNNGFRLWRATRAQIEEQEKVRTAMQQITREIREMKLADNGAFPIESATQQSLIFFANVDADAATERIRIFYQSNQLQRGVIQPTGSPATYPSGSEVVTTITNAVYLVGDLFAYYDQNYTGSEAALTFPIAVQNVHLVEVHFEVDSNPSEAPDATEIRTQITARNLKEYAPNP